MENLEYNHVFKQLLGGLTRCLCTLEVGEGGRVFISGSLVVELGPQTSSDIIPQQCTKFIFHN